MSTIDRIQKLLESRGVERRRFRRELAAVCGISHQAVSQWVSGETGNIKNEHLAKIAKHYKCSIDWLITGRGAMDIEHKEKGSNVISIDSRAPAASSDEIRIPQFDVRAAMGPGQVPADYVETIRHITIHNQYLLTRGVRYSKASNLAVITGYGQSMEGTINDGEPVIIDRGVDTFVGDGVYVFTWDDMLYIKRLQKASPSTFDMISDNPLHKDLVINIADVKIHGKALVVWNCKKL